VIAVPVSERKGVASGVSMCPARSQHDVTPAGAAVTRENAMVPLEASAKAMKRCRREYRSQTT
jgi:hypothetical protein